jgi:hypothetical protein
MRFGARLCVEGQGGFWWTESSRTWASVRNGRQGQLRLSCVWDSPVDRLDFRRVDESCWPVVDDIIDDVHEVTRDTTVVLLNYITKSQKGDHRLQSN